MSAEIQDRVEANARLTGTVAIVLLLPLVVVFATGLAVSRFLLLHALIGFLLIPPVVLKLTDGAAHPGAGRWSQAVCCWASF